MYIYLLISSVLRAGICVVSCFCFSPSNLLCSLFRLWHDQRHIRDRLLPERRQRSPPRPLDVTRVSEGRRLHHLLRCLVSRRHVASLRFQRGCLAKPRVLQCHIHFIHHSTVTLEVQAPPTAALEKPAKKNKKLLLALN